MGHRKSESHWRGSSVFLAHRNWTITQSAEVRLEKVPAYQRHAPEVRAMLAKGASVNTIAAAFGLVWHTARQWQVYAETGQRPTWKSGRPTGNGGKPAKYQELAEQVARLRDEQELSFIRIAARLGVGQSTVTRAYDHAHHGMARQAAEEGRTPQRGRYSPRLGVAAKAKIRKLLKEDKHPREIAKVVGCGVRTVYREKQAMRTEAKPPHPPRSRQLHFVIPITDLRMDKAHC